MRRGYGNTLLMRLALPFAVLVCAAGPGWAASPGAVDLHPVVDLLQQIVDRPTFVIGAFVFAVAASTLANLLASGIKTGAKAWWDGRRKPMP